MKIRINQVISKKHVQDTVTTQLKFYFPDIEHIDFQDECTIVNYLGTTKKEKIIEHLNKIANKFNSLPNIPQKVYFDSTIHDVKEQGIQMSDFKSFDIAAKKFLEVLSTNLEKDTSQKKFLKEQVYGIRKGLNIYRDQPAIIFSALDELFKSYYQLEFAADDLRVPSMISSEIVDKAGYFETGCQHISFVSPISNDPEKYEEFLPSWKTKGEGKSIKSFLKEPKDVLNPALCLHCYPLLQDTVLPNEEVVSFTVLGSCFRDESGNLNNLERLNEFMMREAVFIGNSDQLKIIKSKLESFSLLLGTWLGLKFRIEAATDIFFDENAKLQLFSQLASSNKIEFSVYSSEIDKYMASGSINNHQNHFSKKFDITDDDSTYVNTMCIGYGYNRLTLAILEKSTDGIEELHNELQKNLVAIKSSLAEVNIK